MERTLLLTGVTGFLGKVVLEEALRRRDELGVTRVFVIIRPWGTLDASARFRREVAGSPCFSGLPRDWTRHVEVVEGSLERPGLDLAPAVRQELTAGVTHVLHTAANVSFGIPLPEATRSNVTTSLHLLDLARECSSLQRMAFVSTAYVTPHQGDGAAIAPGLVPLPAPAEDLYREIQNGTASETDLLARSGQPNTYTLTKLLAEHLLLARRGEVPLTILRPSVISASWRHPFPGWIDSPAGFGAFVAMLGQGRMRVVAGRGRARLDLIPVDVVAAEVLAACGADPRAVTIRHVVAGLERSPTVKHSWEVIRDFYRVHRVERRPAIRYMGARGIRFTLAEAVHHGLLPLLSAWRSRRSGAERAAVQIRARLAYLNRMFPYFTSNSFAFQSPAPPPPALPPAYEPEAYLRTVCRGVYRHLLGGNDADWPLAGRTHPGHGSDLRWALGQLRGNLWIRFSAWLVTKVLRRCCDRVTVDIPSFEAARRGAPDGSPLVVVPNHRSYLDFVLGSYLCFARPDLGIPIPHIAATIEFGRIPLLGRILSAMHAFYLRRGVGREDPDLTRRVHALIEQGRTLEFFIEGQRSRSREFLPPKRGLLRCLQSSGRTCTLLPVAFSYDRVPEEAAFAVELSGAPKPKMRLGPLLRWAWRAWRGQIDLGRIHIACGTPVLLTRSCDVHAVSRQVMRRLQEATVATTFHLEAFVQGHPVDGVDASWLRGAIERCGGRVLPSALRPGADLDTRIAATFRHQFAHHFEGNGVEDERHVALHRALFGPDGNGNGAGDTPPEPSG